MITVIGSIKGGSGKTTLCTNLAVMRSKEGHKVLLVDGDDQKSACDWADQRYSRGIDTTFSTIPLYGKSLYREIVNMKDKYDDIIVDVGGRENDSLRAAMTAADIFVVPFRPRSLDIWTLGSVLTLITRAQEVNPNLICYALVNQGDTTGVDNQEAKDFLSQYPQIKCLDHWICQRKSFSNATANGLGIIEFKPSDQKAISEMCTLYSKIYTQ